MPYTSLALIIMGRKGYTMKHTTKTLDEFFKKHLNVNAAQFADDGINGLQVDNDGSEIKKIAFAVDASMDTFVAARDMGADALFVHHGMFWGKVSPVMGIMRDRIKFLLDNNIALFGFHLPLDMHQTLGNNAELARLLGLTNIEPFGVYNGLTLSFKGTLPTPLTINEIADKIKFKDCTAKEIWQFGPDKNTTVAIMSGGGAYNAMDAIKEGVDVFISGEVNHWNRFTCKDAGLNIIGGGHYLTEVWGPLKMMEITKNELNLETEFIYMPTGM